LISDCGRFIKRVSSIKSDIVVGSRSSKDFGGINSARIASVIDLDVNRSLCRPRELSGQLKFGIVRVITGSIVKSVGSERASETSDSAESSRQASSSPIRSEVEDDFTSDGKLVGVLHGKGIISINRLVVRSGCDIERDFARIFGSSEDNLGKVSFIDEITIGMSNDHVDSSGR